MTYRLSLVAVDDLGFRYSQDIQWEQAPTASCTLAQRKAAEVWYQLQELTQSPHAPKEAE